MQQYVTWANTTGTVQQFYTDSTIQVRFLIVIGRCCEVSGAVRLVSRGCLVHGQLRAAFLHYAC